MRLLLMAVIVALGLALTSCSSERPGEISQQLDEVAREYADYYARYYAEYYAEHYAKQYAQPGPAEPAVHLDGKEEEESPEESRTSEGPWLVTSDAEGTFVTLYSYESDRGDEKATLFASCYDFMNPPQMGAMLKWDSFVSARDNIPVDLGWNGQEVVREPKVWMVGRMGDSVIPPFGRAAWFEKSLSEGTQLEIRAHGLEIRSAKFDLTDYSEAIASIRAECK